MEVDFDLMTDPAGRRLPEHVDRVEQRFQKVKVDIHQKLVDSLDLSQIGRIHRERLEAQVRRMAERLCDSQKEVVAEFDRERLLRELLHEVLGLGPLEPLMQDPAVSDILVNGPFTVYLERQGRLELTDIIFANDAHLLRIIQRITSRLGRRIDEASPMVDARLPDGSRVNAVIPPLAIKGPTLSIRRFGDNPLQIQDLLDNGSVRQEIVDFLAAAIEARVGCIVSGGTGAGKTTLLNALSAFIPTEERIITIEDSAELKLRHRHWVQMETRPPNTEGTGEVTQRDLVRNSLRMRPDRIVVGEVRGAEVWDMLQAMNTGHEGSLTTVHANSALDALSRLEVMVTLTGFEPPVSVIRQYIATGIGLIVHLARLRGGVRRVMRVAEIVGIENGGYRVEDIFGYEQLGVGENDTAYGEFFATGYRPACLERLETYGVCPPPELFHERRMPEVRGPLGQDGGQERHQAVGESQTPAPSTDGAGNDSSPNADHG
jgi:pilus assembly protein CpaF